VNDTARTPLFFTDTTLGDGELMPGVSLTPPEKLRIAKALVELGVNSIDAGFPASGPEEIEAIRSIVRSLRGVTVSALCRAVAADIDDAFEALVEAPLPQRAITITQAVSPVHRERRLRKTKAELAALAISSVEYARRHFRNVTFRAEDASRTEIDFLCEIYAQTIEAGATVIVFTDSLGTLTPESARQFLRDIQDRVPNIGRAAVAVNFHNDLGLSTANSLAAIAEGAHIVECGINGMGVRTGNAALEEIAMAVLLNAEQYRRKITIKPAMLRQVSRLVAELTAAAIPANKPVVGRDVFTADTGIHQDGLMQDPEAFLPFPPELLGEHGARLVLGKHSSASAIRARLEQLGIRLPDSQLEEVVARVRTATREEWGDDAALLTRMAAEAAVPARAKHA
jgi:2-isopropylmalate synthase